MTSVRDDKGKARWPQALPRPMNWEKCREESVIRADLAGQLAQVFARYSAWLDTAQEAS